jgi:hypothetical protein
MEEFIDAVRRGGPSPLSGKEGRIPVVMALAASKSWELKRPITLAEVDPPPDKEKTGQGR